MKSGDNSRMVSLIGVAIALLSLPAPSNEIRYQAVWKSGKHPAYTLMRFVIDGFGDTQIDFIAGPDPEGEVKSAFELFEDHPKIQGVIEETS